MGSNNHDIHDKEVIQYIEENMKDGGKLKKQRKLLWKIDFKLKKKL